MNREGYRRICWLDLWFLWRLARERSVRVMSTESRMPTILGHMMWMDRWMDRSYRAAWVVTVDGERAGLVRGERRESPREMGTEGETTLSSYMAVIGISIMPEHRGLGVGSRAVEWANWALTECWPDCQVVEAQILRTNNASVSTFLKSGYVVRREDEHYLYAYWIRWSPCGNS